MDFILNTLWNALTRVVQELEEFPAVVWLAVKNALPTFYQIWQSLVTFDVAFIFVSLANVPFNELSNLLQRLQRIPTLAIVEEAKKVLKPLMPGQTRVMKASDALIMAVDLVADSVSNSARLQIPAVLRFWRTVDGIKSKVSILINGLPMASIVGKLVKKLWFLIVDFAILFWNFGLMVWGLLTLVSILDRAQKGVTDNYVLQQKNPLVKDRTLGRRRFRSASSAP